MIMETLGQRIRKRRKELGWSQENLAHEAGLHKNAISELERDLQAPTPITICQLACALQVNLYYLQPTDCLEMVARNSADVAFREMCDDFYSRERVDSFKTIIAASSVFHPQK